MIFSKFCKAICLFQLLSTALFAKDLLPGDIVLISLNCYICPIIENETDSTVSHLAVILKKTNNDYLLAHAYGEKVTTILLTDFLKLKRNNSFVFHSRHNQSQKRQHFLSQNLLSVFSNNFNTNKYDPDFLWDNYDESGKEKLYCSEFIAKLLNPFFSNKIPTRPMSFDKNYDFWFEYFKGDVPNNLQGVTPAHFLLWPFNNLGLLDN